MSQSNRHQIVNVNYVWIGFLSLREETMKLSLQRIKPTQSRFRSQCTRVMRSDADEEMCEISRSVRKGCDLFHVPRQPANWERTNHPWLNFHRFKRQKISRFQTLTLIQGKIQWLAACVRIYNRRTFPIHIQNNARVFIYLQKRMCQKNYWPLTLQFSGNFLLIACLKVILVHFWPCLHFQYKKEWKNTCQPLPLSLLRTERKWKGPSPSLVLGTSDSVGLLNS